MACTAMELKVVMMLTRVDGVWAVDTSGSMMVVRLDSNGNFVLKYSIRVSREFCIRTSDEATNGMGSCTCSHHDRL